VNTQDGAPRIRTARRLVLLVGVALLSMACATTCRAPGSSFQPTLVEIALYLQGGQPAVLFQRCGGLGGVWISVSEVVDSSTTPWPTSSASPLPRYGFYFRRWGAESGGSDAHPVSSLVLLVLPPGWMLLANMDGEVPLTGFEEGHSYDALTGERTGAAAAAVEFTLADLRALPDGQVWAVPTPEGREAMAMTRDDFKSAAAATCASQSPPTTIAR
jgi:hypothetical protein